MSAKGARRRKYVYDAESRLFTLFLAFFFGLPALLMPFTDGELRSRWENRPLAKFPSDIHRSGEASFFREIDAYLNDHFGFALEMNRIYRQIVFYVFHDSPTPRVTRGEDGFVFLNAHAPGKPFDAFRALCSLQVGDTVAAAAVDSWKHVFDFYAPRVSRVALLIPPSKPALYPEKLPLSVPRELRNTCAQYRARLSVPKAISDWGQSSGVRIVYPIDRFFKERFNGNFYPRENFHFSGASAHLLASLTLASLGIETPAVFDRFTLAKARNDMDQVIGFTRSSTFPSFDYTSFKTKRVFREPAGVLRYYRKATDFGTLNTGNPLSDRNALMISDSFGAFLVEHLAPGYRSLIYVNTNHLEQDEMALFFSEFIQTQKVDDLLFVFHDGAVGSRGRSLAAVLADVGRRWPVIGALE
ncbi:MAG: hypothetical protein LJE61_13150 [Thiocapsa sp.]|nr:hypothetical protein [Thiocapsa sp.]MCG6897174.1 hypothetical protein [Thiocapsa sp.]MCG6986131.1 hypothetical protein [Thiocapsa sp.]